MIPIVNIWLFLQLDAINDFIATLTNLTADSVTLLFVWLISVAYIIVSYIIVTASILTIIAIRTGKVEKWAERMGKWAKLIAKESRLEKK